MGPRKTQEWEKVEIDACSYMKERFPENFIISRTGDDSNQADILIVNPSSGKSAYGEAKKLPSAGGAQLVVARENDKFTAKNSENPVIRSMLDLLNDPAVDATSYNHPAAIEFLSQNLRSKDVHLLYLVFRKAFVLVPIENLFKYVDVKVQKPRLKRSGSRSVAKMYLPIIRNYFSENFGEENVSFCMEGKDLWVDIPKTISLPDILSINGKEYLAKKMMDDGDKTRWRIKKRGETIKLTATISLVKKPGIKFSSTAEENQEVIDQVTKRLS